jgi:hypothetical protein
VLWPLSLQQTSVAGGVIGFLIPLVRAWGTGVVPDLGKVISKMLAGSAIPTGAYLLFCGFRPEFVKELHDLGLYLAAAGLALLFVSAKEMWTA